MTQSLRDTGKVILKLLFLGVALSFIFSRLFHREHFQAIREILTVTFFRENIFIFLSLFVLLILNLLVESLKWRYVMKDVCRLSLLQSVIGILSGIAAGMFTPNRTGEFIGRIIQLPEGSRVRGVFGSMILSLIQLLCTIVFGLAGLMIISIKIDLSALIPPGKIILWTMVILIILIITLFILFRAKITGNARSMVEILQSFRKRSLFWIGVLSSARYIVFTTQFILALILFNVKLDVSMLFGGVAVFFLVTSAIPSFLFLEIITRGATAVSIFSSLGTEDTPVFFASTFIWMLNIILPSLAGALIIALRKP